MELENVLRRVRRLIDKAEHESTPPEEASLAQKMADALMLEYSIEEARLDSSRPAISRSKPETVIIALTGDSTLVGYMANLASNISDHCGCKIRHYVSYHEGAWQSKVYGYESDVRYFEMLYTILRLHMVDALRPAPDLNKSIEENSYTLHNAGYNWYDIAKMYGWQETASQPGEPRLMYRNTKTGERQGWSRAIAQYKRAYARAVEGKGESGIRIPPAATGTFRINAANGYVIRIDQRLCAIRESRQQIGNALALRVDELDRMFREENEDLFKPAETDAKNKRRPARVKHVPYNTAGYQSGVNRANTAALNQATSNNPVKGIT